MIPRRVPIPILAVVALAILLGHDVLMTADPHEPLSAHAHDHDSPAVECHLPEASVRASPDRFDTPPANLAPCTVPEDAGVRELRRAFYWDAPPGRPPDTLRALLQVFLN